MHAPDSLITFCHARFSKQRQRWLVFRAINIYRLILAALLLTAFAFDEHNRMFGRQDAYLFLTAGLTYLGLVVIAMFTSHWRCPPLLAQAHTLMLVDLVALTVIINASGGLSSSLNSLLITAVAANSIVLPLISALLGAALGFFFLIASWLFDLWRNAEVLAHLRPRYIGSADSFWAQLQSAADDWVHLGVLGLVLFMAAGFAYALAEWARRGEQLAQQRTWELLEAAELNQGIIRHLQNGVVVVNAQGEVQLMNDAARQWLEVTEVSSATNLQQISAPLAAALQGWLQHGSDRALAFRPADHCPELLPRFTKLSGHQAVNILILLENSEETAAQLQQIKLAALGRLTASIAHEIRNPLTAISHAVQLLQESTATPSIDRRLATIAYENVKRANRIIGDVLDLARRDRVKPEWLPLQPWLEEFREDFLRATDAPPPAWQQQVAPAYLTVYFDPHQLRQVLWNLCSNACQHSVPAGQRPHITIDAYQMTGQRRPCLEIRDAGIGIAPEQATRLFEPFFTTRAKGNGLGLYLARELCEANQAQLQYRPSTAQGCCFRITFAHPESSTTEINS